MKPAHTQTPWYAISGGHISNSVGPKWCSNGSYVAHISESRMSADDQAFMLRACNGFEQLEVELGVSMMEVDLLTAKLAKLQKTNDALAARCEQAERWHNEACEKLFKAEAVISEQRALNDEIAQRCGTAIAHREALVSALREIVDLQGKCANGMPLSENELRKWAITNHAARAALALAEGK